MFDIPTKLLVSTQQILAEIERTTDHLAGPRGAMRVGPRIRKGLSGIVECDHSPLRPLALEPPPITPAELKWQQLSQHRTATFPGDPKLANMRDFGGLPTVDGRETVFGRVYRSGIPEAATPEAMNDLVGTKKIRTVIDLRSERDHARYDGTAWRDNPDVSLIRQTVGTKTYVRGIDFESAR